MSTQLASLRRFLASGAPRYRGRGEGNAIGVGSGKGGTGTSTIAALVALVGAADGKRTLLIDADPEFAVLHLLLGGEAGPGLGRLREGAPVESLLTTAAPNLELLSCMAGVEEGHSPLLGAEWEPLLRRVPAIYGEFDLIVADLGSRLEGLRAIESLDIGRLLAVTETDRVTLAATHALIKRFATRALGLPASVIFNRSRDPEALASFNVLREGVGRFLARTIEFNGALPDDARYRQAVEGGETIQGAATRSTLASAILNLAPRIIPNEEPATASQNMTRQAGGMR